MTRNIKKTYQDERETEIIESAISPAWLSQKVNQRHAEGYELDGPPTAQFKELSDAGDDFDYGWVYSQKMRLTEKGS